MNMMLKQSNNLVNDVRKKSRNRQKNHVRVDQQSKIVFFDKSGVVHYEYVLQSQTVNKEYHGRLEAST